MRYLIILLFAFSTLSYAATEHQGGQEGNGGDVLTCPNKAPQLLDFYEAESKGLYNTFPIDQNYELIVQEVISYYQSQFPEMANIMTRDFAEFTEKNQSGEHKNIRFEWGTELTDIPDSGHISIPSGCKVKQIAIQIVPKYEEDKRYTIDGDLWDILPAIDRAGLVIHELLYKQGIKGGVKNSIDIRYLNAVLFAKKFHLKSDSERFKILASSRQPVIDFTADESILSLPVYQITKKCSEYGTDCHNEIKPMTPSFREDGSFDKYATNNFEMKNVSFRPKIAFRSGISFLISEIYYSNGYFYQKRNQETDKSYVGFYGDALANGTYNKKEFELSFSNLGKGGFCSSELMQNGMNCRNKLKTNRLEAFSSENTLKLESIMNLLSSPVTIRSLKSNSFSQAILELDSSNDLELQNFLGSDKGRWIAPVSSGKISYFHGRENDQINTSILLEWQHANGKLFFKANSFFQIDDNGNPIGSGSRGIGYFQGFWKTTFGSDFDANPEEAGSINLTLPDYTFRKGTSNKGHHIAREQFSVNFRTLDCSRKDDICDFSSIKQAVVNVQGRSLTYDNDIYYEIGVKKDQLVYIYLIKSTDLKFANGKIKKINATRNSPTWVVFDSSGLVIKTGKP